MNTICELCCREPEFCDCQIPSQHSYLDPFLAQIRETNKLLRKILERSYEKTPEKPLSPSSVRGE